MISFQHQYDVLQMNAELCRRIRDFMDGFFKHVPFLSVTVKIKFEGEEVQPREKQI